jgi:hypothetical protein
VLTLIIVYVILIAAVVGLYVVSQRLRKGSRQSFWQWLKSGFFAGTGVTPRVDRQASPTQPGHPNQAAEVIAVLEDIYEEFLSETAKLRKEFQSHIARLESTWAQQLDDLVKQVGQMQQRLELQSSRSDAGEDVRRVPRSGGETSSDIYFSILDELHAGTPPVQIASRLGVSLDEVVRVRKMMESPGFEHEPH